MRLPVDVEVTADPAEPRRALIKFQMKRELEHAFKEVCERYYRRPLNRDTKAAIAADIERALQEYMRDD